MWSLRYVGGAGASADRPYVGSFTARSPRKSTPAASRSRPPVAVALPAGGRCLVAAARRRRGHDRRARERAAAVAARTSCPITRTPATSACRGMSERELRAMETATLGPEHAREHAMMRRARQAREPQASGGGRAARPTRRTAAADAAAAGDPARGRRAGRPPRRVLPIVAIHAALLPTGKVMVFSYPTYPAAELLRGVALEPRRRVARCRRTRRLERAPGQHLVRRPDLHRRRRAGRVRRQPRVPDYDAQGTS